MKKHLSKIWVNILILMLCVCASTIGAYALISANLNLTTNVGYVSFNCTANISAKITGSSTTAGGAIADKSIAQMSVTGKNNQVQTMDLGTFYFTENGVKNAKGKPFPIKIWFTIENTSEFPICVDVSLPTITDVEVVADKTSHVIQANTTDFIMVTMTITDSSTRSLETPVTISDFGLTLRKFLFTKADIQVYNDAEYTQFENHPYYIKWGTYREQYELYWLIAGTIDENGQTVALTEADKTQLNTGKMATDKNYYLLCGATLFGNFSSENYVFRTVPMQNNFQYGPSAETDTMLFDYPEITNIKDYSLSISRAYLTGHTVVTEIEKDTTNYTITPVEGGETSINMQNLYRLRGNIYSLIQKRSLTAIYKTLGYNNAEMEIPTDKADNLSSNEADAFWIPTKYDLDNLGDDIEAYSLESRENINAYYVHTQASSGHHLSIYNIDYTGVMRKYSCADIFPSQSYSVRPAFIL